MMITPKSVVDFIFTREPSTTEKFLGRKYRLKYFSKVLDEYSGSLSLSQLAIIRQCVEEAMNEYARANQVVLIRNRRPGFSEWKYEFTEEGSRNGITEKNFFKEVSALAEAKITKRWNNDASTI